MLPNKVAISTPSLGRHVLHRLDQKIRLAAQYGFQGIEMVYGDLEAYSQSRKISLTQGAQAMRELCNSCGLEILSLAPFENFEGSKRPLVERLGIAEQWMDLVRTLGAAYLQVPAQYNPDSVGDDETIISELRQLADLGRATEPVISIAFEPMSWSIHYSTWESVLELIRKVDRPNFGMCLDNFHIHTKLWANPHDAGGKYPNADQNIAASLARFKREMPLDKLFFVQLSDAERFDPPFSKAHPWYLEGEAAEFSWSRHGRPFPGEAELGGYLPVAEFLRSCVADTGFNGWVSLEVFDQRMYDGKYRIEDAAARAQGSWEGLLQQVGDQSSRL